MTDRMESVDLANQIDSALTEYLATTGEQVYSSRRIKAVRSLNAVLWDNKAGIIALLRASPAGGETDGALTRAMDMLADVPGDTLDDRLTKFIGYYMAFQIEVPQLRAQLEATRKALQFIADGYENHNVNHVDYRVKVYQVATDALEGLRS